MKWQDLIFAGAAFFILLAPFSPDIIRFFKYRNRRD